MEQYRNEYKGKKVLITGGAGCIGSNLTRALIEAEAAKIIVLDDLSAAEKWNIPVAPSVDFIEGSIVAEKMLEKIIADFSDQKIVEVALLVNGLGATPLMELYLLNNSVNKILANNSIKVYKTLVGNYMTSIDMAGASVTILNLDSELKELLEDPADSPALKMLG